MAALLASDGSPLLIKLPDGRIVPASGGALVDTAPAPVAAAAMDNSGAMNAQQIRAAGDQAAAQIAAAQALPEVLTAKRGGGAGRSPNVAANRAPAPGLALPQQPAVMTAPEGSGADTGALAGLLKSLGKNAGSGDPVTPTPTTSAAASEPGLLEKFKNFLGIGDKVPNSAAPIDPNMQTAPGPGPVSSAPLAPIDGSQDGALAAVSAPAAPADGKGALVQIDTAKPNAVPANDDQPGFLERNFGGIIDHGDPLTNGANADTIKARYGDDYKPQDWLDRLKANGSRLALLTGGLATMANASRPGATPLGAVGEGALAGINTAYGQRAQQRQEDLAAAEEASKAKLRDAQSALYSTKGDAALTNADANKTRAGAAVKAADARQTAADAAMKRAENPFSSASKTSDFEKKQAAWLAANPGDAQGALAYANGEKQMSGGMTMKSAYSLATQELAGMIDQPANPDEWIDNRASEIRDRILAQDKVRAAPPVAAPTNGALPASKNPGGALPPAAKTAAKGLTRAQIEAQAAAALQRGASPAEVKKRKDALLAAAPE